MIDMINQVIGIFSAPCGMLRQQVSGQF